MKQLAALLYFSPVILAALCWQTGDMVYLGAVAGVVATIALGIKTGKLPIVKQRNLDGANGRNWPLYVEMDPDALMYKAVLAQELYESIRKTNPYHLIRSRIDGKDLELRGHEVEVQAAVRFYDADADDYRWKEAQVMPQYKQFKGMTAEQIETGMLKYRDMAEDWVDDNAGRIA